MLCKCLIQIHLSEAGVPGALEQYRLPVSSHSDRFPVSSSELRGKQSGFCLGCSEETQPGTLEVNKQPIVSFELTTSFPAFPLESQNNPGNMAQLTAHLESHS